MRNEDLFDDMDNENIPTEDEVTVQPDEDISDTVDDIAEDDDDLAIDAMFARRRNSRRHFDEDDDVRTEPPQRTHRPDTANAPQYRQNAPADRTDGQIRQDQPRPEPEEVTFTARDVNEASSAITRMLEAGRLGAALDITFSLRGALRAAVRDTVTVTIPLGSHASELRQIAAGAMIQSYLEQGRIVGEDIEDKLYAIIESSEPEYDRDGEIIEQTPDEILYKVTACTVFCAQLTEASGRHPAEKAAMFASDDSVLDTFLTANIDRVMKKERRHLLALDDAVRMNGGAVSAKLDAYVEKSKKDTENFIMKFLGDSFTFRVTACVIAALCLVSVIVYLCSRSGLLSLFATDSKVMLFLIAVEVFFTAGMVLLAIFLGYKSSDGPTEGRIPANAPQTAQRPPRR